MTDKDFRRQWSDDAELLAEIGRELFYQRTTVKVCLPRSFADRALAAWERDDEGPLSSETPTEAVIRHRAGALALIGLSVQEGGTLDGDEVVVEVDAWQIGEALAAAGENGLLDGLSKPGR